MKRFLFSMLFALHALMTFAQMQPTKADFNNFLILVAGSRFPWQISDLSFDDFQRNVVVETIGYRNQFGEMVREESGSKTEWIRYDAQENVYRFYNCTVNPDNVKRLNFYWGSSLDEVYIVPEQSGDITVYDGSGAYKKRNEVKIDNQRRITWWNYYSYTYDDKTNEIIKKEGIDGTLLEIEKRADTWTVKDKGLFGTIHPTKKVTILERNEKGLWTRLIIEYMNDPVHNADPVKTEVIRYFDVEDDPNLEEEEAAEEVVEEKAIPFALVEVKPKFQGGDANTFSKWVALNLEYPANAKANGVSGRVMVEFIVNTDGSVSDVKVLRGVDPELDAEAIRVIQSSPKWTPGEQRDSPVKVGYQFPVIFQAR